MNTSIRRNSFQPHLKLMGGGDRDTTDEHYEAYKLQTRGEYEDLMMEFEFRCKRAATMHYYEAAGYDKKIYLMELLSSILGSMSALSVGFRLLKGSSLLPSFPTQTPFLSSLSAQGPVLTSVGAPAPARGGDLGTLGTLGIGLACLLSTKLLPSFSSRQTLHVSTAAAWQKLAMKTRSYRINLDNPHLDVDTYQAWYLALVEERETLCTRVTVPQATYKLYCDAKRVFKPLRERRMMYLKYLQLEDMTIEETSQPDRGEM